MIMHTHLTTKTRSVFLFMKLIAVTATLSGCGTIKGSTKDEKELRACDGAIDKIPLVTLLTVPTTDPCLDGYLREVAKDPMKVDRLMDEIPKKAKLPPAEENDTGLPATISEDLVFDFVGSIHRDYGADKKHLILAANRRFSPKFAYIEIQNPDSPATEFCSEPTRSRVLRILDSEYQLKRQSMVPLGWVSQWKEAQQVYSTIKDRLTTGCDLMSGAI